MQIINEELITLKPTTCAFGMGLGDLEPLFMDFYLLMDILYIGSIGHASGGGDLIQRLGGMNTLEWIDNNIVNLCR